MLTPEQIRHAAIWEARRQKYHKRRLEILGLLRTMTWAEAAATLGMSTGNAYRIVRTVIHQPK